MKTFHQMLQESIEDENEELYGKILISEEFGEDNPQIIVSLINRFMIGADLGFFYRDGQLKDANLDIEIIRDIDDYHPYIYEFVVDSDIEDNKAFLIQNAGRWLPVTCIKEGSKNSGVEGIRVEGTLFFSASPLEKRGRQLVFNRTGVNNALCDWLAKNVTVAKLKRYLSSKEISGDDARCMLRKTMPSDPAEICGAVYKVGNANSIVLDIRDDFRTFTILYDVGVTTNENIYSDELVQYNLKHFKEVDFDAVILSHWDLDHILAVGEFNPEKLYSKETPWIVPDICLLDETSISVSAMRLSSFIANTSTCDFIDNLGNMCFGVSGYFSIWQGDGRGKNSGEVKNNIGLLIKIDFCELSNLRFSGIYPPKWIYRNRKFSALLCGDCMFEHMPVRLLREMYCLIVSPHHGSEKTDAGKLCYQQDGVVIISADTLKIRGEDYEFPSDLHIKRLWQVGFGEILITKNDGNIFFRLEMS